MKQIKYTNASSCFVDADVVFLGDATIGPNTTLIGKCIIGDNAYITNSHIENSEIGEKTKVIYSYIESSVVKDNCKIGPFSHLRPNSLIDNNCKIGNFVEIKNSHIADNGKVSHLSYVGDADVGENVNVGCGVVFVNYDGKNKHKTSIGNNCFIGSNSNLIAPLNLGDQVFIAAGSTITKDLKDRQFCIARAREYIKDEYKSPYSPQFTQYTFGTDGIRISGDEKEFYEMGARFARALQASSKIKNIAIGMDTRPSSLIIKKTIIENFSGLKIFDVGVCSTPCLAFMTQNLGCDFGVMITASHNPENFNGVKLFNKNGQKINELLEKNIEKSINNKSILEKKVKKCEIKKVYPKNYILHTQKQSVNLNGFEVAIDVSGGSSEKLAKKVFEMLGAKVHIIGKSKDHKINDNCGCLYLDHLKNYMRKNNIPLGFAFDGDGDRVLAVDETLNVIDGDNFLYLLAKYFKAQNKLNKNCVVCTQMTNLATIQALNKLGIAASITPVGDKYVIEEMNNLDSSLGGEQSGHIITKDICGSGDGLLCAVMVCSIIKTSGKTLHNLSKIKFYPQFQHSFPTSKNAIILEDPILKKQVAQFEKDFCENGRILLRKSGTEPKLRLLVECKNKRKAKKVFDALSKTITSLI